MTEQDRRQAIVNAVNSSQHKFNWNYDENNLTGLVDVIRQAAQSIGGADILIGSIETYELLKGLINEYEFSMDPYLPTPLLIVAKKDFLNQPEPQCAIVIIRGFTKY